MAGDYQRMFSSLARDYQITLMADSLLLPAPMNCAAVAARSTTLL